MDVNGESYLVGIEAVLESLLVDGLITFSTAVETACGFGFERIPIGWAEFD